MKDFTYKCYVLAINELPNFKNSEDKLYRGTTIIDGKKWEKDGSAVYLIESWFRDKIDNLYKCLNYERLVQVWGSDSKKITYKNHVMWVKALLRAKDKKVFYIGTYYFYDVNRKFSSTFESIHYDKVVSKFERFVDEYCTNWLYYNTQQISDGTKLYTLDILVNLDGSSYFGKCNIHKNSTFKCISTSTKEIEEKWIARISQIIKHRKPVRSNLDKLIEMTEELGLYEYF